MKFKEIWEKNIHWVFVLWVAYAFFFKISWLWFAIGLLVGLVVLFLTAPGVFLTYVYLLSINTRYDKEKTVDKLQKIITKKPLIPLPYFSLAVTYVRLERWQESIAPLEEAIKLSNKKAQQKFKMILVISFREVGAYERSLELLDELVAQGVKNNKVYYNYAMCYMKMARLDEAIASAEQARVLNLNAPEPVILMAKIYFLMGKYQNAIDNYEWVITHIKWPVESFYWLGRAELEIGAFDKAVEHLQQAVERIENDPSLSDVTVAEARIWLEKAKSKSK